MLTEETNYSSVKQVMDHVKENFPASVYVEMEDKLGLQFARILMTNKESEKLFDLLGKAIRTLVENNTGSSDYDIKRLMSVLSFLIGAKNAAMFSDIVAALRKARDVADYWDKNCTARESEELKTLLALRDQIDVFAKSADLEPFKAATTKVYLK